MPAVAAAPPGTIRLLTANLWSEGADPSGLADQLVALRVDVACFQELGAQQAAAIARVLPHGKLEPGASRHDHDGMGIAARRPLALSRISLPKRDARRAELDPRDWPELGVKLELINLHIQAPHVFPPWRSLALRRQQVAMLLPHFAAAPETARVVCGDFNATPLWPVYRALASSTPDLVLEHAALRREKPRRTWGPWSGAPRLLRIDHVLGAGVLAANVQVVQVRGSDHSAVVVDLVSET
jgi:endonuclease/exonuclease/phosphatase family metal-dependent hydrolase